MGAHSDQQARARSDALHTAERWLLVAVAALVLALLLIEIVGGRSWAWTGFQDNQHLWDWLHLLLLPVVLSLLPVLSRRRAGPVGRRWLIGLSVLGLAVAALVVLGYAVPWSWTGFSGNTLWDWLELLLLPVSVALLPFVLESGTTARVRWVTGFSLFLVAFGLLSLPGYAVPWRWTGVTGNTLWDWIELLVVPFALPVTVTLVLHHSRHADHS
jgi:hypothetical protein